MYCPNLSEEMSEPHEQTVDTGRLLRSLGATGRLLGYQYMIYIVEKVLKHPEEHFFLTKSLYPETAKHFHVSYASVERAIRTLIQTIWISGNQAELEYIAGHRLSRIPTNGEFIDMIAAYIQFKS